VSNTAGREVVIVDAVRSPVGKRNGGLSTMHSADLLGAVLRELVERSGVDATEVGQVVGGCVGQVGMQTFNVTRTAWLTVGLPLSVAATTVDAQCGSSQQAVNLAAAMVASGVTDVAVGCGVEIMSRIPIGAALARGLDLGKAVPKSYFSQYEYTSQFEGAERIAKKWGITRDDTDAFGLQSQQRARAAWDADRFKSQLAAIDVPDLDDDGKPTGTTHAITRDEGLRDTTLEGLGGLKPVLEDGVHTAGSSSQVSDGASAVLFMTAELAEERGLEPLARVVDTCLVGVDPVLMLTGPIDATRHLLGRTGWTMDDLDVVEINEAFASVVLAWAKELGADPEIVNPNGGAIALGHPLGATGAGLVAKAAHELRRSHRDRALVTMCCGGGLGTGTLLERL
jgi:acetyl-CoA C-acetyltransferase